MRIVEFIVAGRPLAKGRVRFTGAGHAYTPERTVAYESQVALAAQAAMRGRPPDTGPVAVWLHVYLPIAPSWPLKKQMAAELGHLRPTGRPDLDNFAKTLDALNHIVWADDSQIVELHVFKRYDQSPRLAVIVDTVGA
jgi:Holliday junction resolvase RusA-like endonuclease